MSDTLSNQSEHEGGVLLKELADIKEMLREISRELLRIERRVKAAFQTARPLDETGDLLLEKSQNWMNSLHGNS